MTNPVHNLIAHELGHAIYGYLYEPEQYPTSMSLKGTGGVAGYLEFEEWEGLPVIDGNVAKIKGNSYLGGLFGELIWQNQTQVMGLRGDIDELLTGLRYVGKPGSYRRSRSKLFAELWAWFYTDRDDWSYGGMMKLWYDNSHRGKIMHASRVKTRLPETWKLYEKFAKNIDHDAFRVTVKDIEARNTPVLYRQSLKMYGRRIIPDTVLHPEDI